MRLESTLPGNTPPLSLPRIGQANYLPLLIEALRGLQPPDQFDARIFVGLLIAIIAGEKNLIVDVDARDLARELRNSADHRQPYGGSLPLTDGSIRSISPDLLEARVQRTVEAVSHLVPSECLPSSS